MARCRRPQGTLRVRWGLDDQGRLVIEWTETGGPVVTEAGNRGFGSMLIERQLAFELKGHSDMQFTGTGVRVTLQVPMEALRETNRDKPDGD